MKRAVRVAKSEVPAIARQAWLILRARAARGLVTSTRHVVLVHGFMAAPSALDPISQVIEERLGLSVSTFGYAPFGRFESIADRLSSFVDDVATRHAQISLVGHSLGGLLSRYYAQELDRTRVIDRVITLAAPHDGTPAAHALPTGLARAMRPGSSVLRRLRASRAFAPPTYSLLAEDDHLIEPQATAAMLDCAEVRVLPGIGHNGVLYDPRAYDFVVESLAR